MNEAYKNLIERRSIRKYNNTKVSHDLIEQIVRAGQFAPSGMNRQIYAFVVVEDEELVARLSKMNADAMNSSSDPFYGAKSLIIVFADTNAPTYLYDGALAMGNLMNAANALGVDSCWIHRAKEVFETPEGKEMKKTWGLPESYEGIGHCILGYREEEPGERAQRTSKVIYA
ncbi:nitroreductase [Holdemanella biformis]|jgi:nitroreductase|uniref:nitroreductase family protein n=1 Tax=Holdemanella biformis TaxID=1735 RepID=UPI001C277D22|nr:nitroreductase [Holdemanella biformis]MBU9894997.1 nitroreductase [Holdemanella biformis]MBV3416035.1 nitroreductase [Holdemanella biformis]